MKPHIAMQNLLFPLYKDLKFIQTYLFLSFPIYILLPVMFNTLT